MYPILWQSGSLIIGSWHVFYLLAALAAWWTLQLWFPIIWPVADSRKIDMLFLLSYCAGYFGARGFSVLFESEAICWCWSTVRELFQIGSMTLYGGVLAATVAALLYARYWRLPVRQLADLTLPPSLLGIAVGRIGCLLNGDDFGREIADQLHPAWWSLRMPNLEDGLYRYPVQVWESMFCLALAGLCWSQRGRTSGTIGSIGILGYTLFRFVVEFYRGDERGHFLVEFFSPAQVISFLVGFVWLLFLRQSRPRKTLAAS